MRMYFEGIKRYADFEGRSSRREYWLFTLFNYFFVFVAMFMDLFLNTNFERLPYGWIYLLYALFILIPGLAVTVRRLHDIDKSGWTILVALIPIAGPIWFLILMFTNGDEEENGYGEVSKREINEEKQVANISSLLLSLGIFFFVSRLYWFVLSKFVDNYYSTFWFKISDTVLGLIWALVPILIAFSIQNRNKQIIVFILGGIYMLFSLYQILINIVKYTNDSGFQF